MINKSLRKSKSIIKRIGHPVKLILNYNNKNSLDLTKITCKPLIIKLNCLNIMCIRLTTIPNKCKIYNNFNLIITVNKIQSNSTKNNKFTNHFLNKTYKRLKTITKNHSNNRMITKRIYLTCYLVHIRRKN